MKRIFTILVVEDEVLIAEFLKEILLDEGFGNVILAHSEEEAREVLSERAVDLIFLDIRLNHDLNGLQLAEYIQEEFKKPIIFVTANTGGGIMERALATKPAAFISKPFRKADVIAAANIAVVSFAKQVLTVKDGWKTVKLRFEDIFMAQSDGNYIRIFTENKVYLVRYTLSWFEENVPEDLFIKSHRSSVVNKHKVASITTTTLTLTNNKTVPVSRSGYKNIKPLLQ